MNEDGKEFMKLILSVIVIVLCSGCFRNNSPISVELSSVERNDTLYLEFEFTNNTEDSLFFVLSKIISVCDCGYTEKDFHFSSIESMIHQKQELAKFNIQNVYPKVELPDTLKLKYPLTEVEWGEEWDVPCVINSMVYDYYTNDFPLPISKLEDKKWLDKDVYNYLKEYYKRKLPNEEDDFFVWMPSESLVLLPSKSTKRIKIDVSYLIYLKVVYLISLDHITGDINDDFYDEEPEEDTLYNDNPLWFQEELTNLGYKKYTERLTSNAITIDTRNMKLP